MIRKLILVSLLLLTTAFSAVNLKKEYQYIASSVEDMQFLQNNLDYFADYCRSNWNDLDPSYYNQNIDQLERVTEELCSHNEILLEAPTSDVVNTMLEIEQHIANIYLEFKNMNRQLRNKSDEKARAYKEYFDRMEISMAGVTGYTPEMMAKIQYYQQQDLASYYSNKRSKNYREIDITYDNATYTNELKEMLVDVKLLMDLMKVKKKR